MSGNTFEGYYTPHKSKLLSDFDKRLKQGRRVLAAHYSDDLADAIMKESHREYEALIPKIPNIGGGKNISETDLIQSTWGLALYRSLKPRGISAEETGRILYELVESQLNSVPGWMLHLLGRWSFRKYNVNNMMKLAAESQKRVYPGDWVWSYFVGDGVEFDSGVDYTECAICKFFHSQGADELAPYMCRTDFLISKTFDMGLVRTMTIAEGGEKCDFRYKKGRETKINF